MSFQTTSKTSNNAYGITTSGTTIPLSIDTAGTINVATWEAPVDIGAVLEKYFELKGDVANNPKEFIEAISSLPGVDDNFKAIKLYDLLKKGKHREFKEQAKKYQQAVSPAYTFNSDSDTGIYYGVSGSDQITFTSGGTATTTNIPAGSPIYCSEGVK